MYMHSYPGVVRVRRAGLTLLELVVVLGVLALLGALVVPKIAGLVERTRSSTQAYSTADVSRQLEIFIGMNSKYPDGWDMLMTGAGTFYGKLNSLLTASYTTTTGGAGTTVGPILTTATLDDDQISSLSLAGIGHAFLHDSTSVPSNSGTDRRHFGTGNGHDETPNVNTFAVVNEAVGSRGRSILITDFGLNPNRNEPDTHATNPYPRLNKNVYVVFGIGPKCTIVQSQILEAPLMDNAQSTTTYSRPLVVFEVPEPASPQVAAKLVGVLGPDGRTKAMSISDYKNVNGVQPH